MSKTVQVQHSDQINKLFKDPKVIAWYDLFNGVVLYSMDDAILSHQGGNVVHPIYAFAEKPR